MEPIVRTVAPETGTKLAAAGRVEIDTSAPFESVKEAVDRFGGSAVWKSQLRQFLSPERNLSFEEADITKVEEQTAQLEKDLILKEKETLIVLKELEMTKKIMDELKSKLRREAFKENNIPGVNSDSKKVYPVTESEECCSKEHEIQVDLVSPDMGPMQSPGSILIELKQAKLNLSRTTSDLDGIQASIELLNSKIEKEKSLLDKARQKLSADTAKVSSLEEELSQTTLKLQVIKDAECKQQDPSDISRKIKELNSETEHYKKIAEAAKSQISKLTAELEQTKASIKTAEVRWLAAKKMEDAARAAEAAALSQIKAVTNSDDITDPDNVSNIALPMEEYIMLMRKAEEAEEVSRKKIEAAMLEVDEADCSKNELLIKVEEAKKEVKTSRKVLDEALKREEAASRAKLAVEEALRKWRSEHGQKRRSVYNSTKFKNSGTGHCRRDSRMLDVNGLSLVADRSRSAVTIGQILSKKLMSPEDYDSEVQGQINVKQKVSLGQMLHRKNGVMSPPRTEDVSGCKQFPAKRKKFGIVGLLVLANQNKKNKKKRHTCNPQERQSS